MRLRQELPGLKTSSLQSRILPLKDARHVIISEPTLDLDNHEDFRLLLEAEVFSAVGDVILQLDGIEFISSIALGLISLAAVTVAKRGAQLVVVCSREEVLKLFVVSGLYKGVKIASTVESAQLKLVPAGIVSQ